jgi:ribonuclease HI
MKMKIYADGGSFPNPGQMAIAVVVMDDDKEIFSEAKKIGEGTNNIAEYEACIMALEIAKEKGWKKFKLCIDSQLVANQLAGQWKIKGNFRSYYDKFMDYRNEFDEVEMVYVRSEENYAHKGIEKLLNISNVPMFKFGKRCDK